MRAYRTNKQASKLKKDLYEVRQYGKKRFAKEKRIHRQQYRYTSGRREKVIAKLKGFFSWCEGNHSSHFNQEHLKEDSEILLQMDYLVISAFNIKLKAERITKTARSCYTHRLNDFEHLDGLKDISVQVKNTIISAVNIRKQITATALLYNDNSRKLAIEHQFLVKYVRKREMFNFLEFDYSLIDLIQEPTYTSRHEAKEQDRYNYKGCFPDSSNLLPINPMTYNSFHEVKERMGHDLFDLKVQWTRNIDPDIHEFNAPTNKRAGLGCIYPKVCKEIIDLGGVTQLAKKPKHIVTSDLDGENMIAHRDSSLLLCGLCINQNEAVNWCGTCNLNICFSCTCFHNDVRMMMNHCISILP